VVTISIPLSSIPVTRLTALFKLVRVILSRFSTIKVVPFLIFPNFIKFKSFPSAAVSSNLQFYRLELNYFERNNFQWLLIGDHMRLLFSV